MFIANIHVINIHLGGLFHPGDDHQEIAFRYAVENINNDRTILPRSKIVAQIEKISPQDSFHASKRGKLWQIPFHTKKHLMHLKYSTIAVCHLLRTGVAAIFGPQSPHTASHVQSICDTMEVNQFLFIFAILIHIFMCISCVYTYIGSTFGDTMGLPIASRKLPRQFVPASQHIIKGECTLHL